MRRRSSVLLKEQIERGQCMSTFTLYTVSSRGTVSRQLSKELRRLRIFLIEDDGRWDGQSQGSAVWNGPSPSMPDHFDSPAIAASRRQYRLFKHQRRRQ